MCSCVIKIVQKLNIELANKLNKFNFYQIRLDLG